MKSIVRCMIVIAVTISNYLNTAYAVPPDKNHKAPMKEQFENSLRYAELSKKVYEAIVINNMENPDGWSVKGIGAINFTRERFIDGGQSLRFSTPMRDDAYIARIAKERGSYSGGYSRTSDAVLTLPQPQDWTKYNRIAAWVYVHPVGLRAYGFSIHIKCLDAKIPVGDECYYGSYIQNLKPGEWNYITWEISNLKRDKIVEFSIRQELRGHDPDIKGVVIFDIDRIELQRVDAEKYEGWETEPGKISFNHLGYKPENSKTAITDGLSAGDFQLVDYYSEKILLSKAIQQVSNDLGKFQVLDFSEVRKIGKYFIRAGESKTRPFLIADTLWRQPIYKALNFYYSERCGFDIPGVHSPCHMDVQGIHNGEKKVISGGWHDAGDLSQGTFRTGGSIYAMLEILSQLSVRNLDPPLQENIIEEALWGLEYMLKTRFGNGYRVTWCAMGMYTDGIIGTIDDVIQPATNIPWENFHAAGVEAYAYRALMENNASWKNKYGDIADRCLQAAKEDWEAAAQAQISAKDDIYLIASWGVISSIHLFQITGDRKYSEKAIEYGRLILNCQERQFIDGIPFAGYFYNNPDKTTILHHFHAAFEEAPLFALGKLCAAFPDHEDWIEWYGAAVLHSEYFVKRGAEYNAPYYMLSNSVYRKSEILRVSDPDVQKRMMQQFYEGTRLTDEHYLRRFPIWVRERPHLTGNTNVQLSQTMALTSSVQLRNDLAGDDLAAKQLQWVFGGNPFSQSLMYGEGYDYASLFAVNSGDIVGALPVGIECAENDAPYWAPSNFYTFKEIWVVPVSRFLWNAAYQGMPAFIRGSLQGTGVNNISVTGQGTDIIKPVPVDADGKFRACLPAGHYSINYGTGQNTLNLVSGGNYNLELNTARSIDFAAEVKVQNAVGNSIFIEIEAEGNGIHTVSLRLFNGITENMEKIIELEPGKKEKIIWEVELKDSITPWVAVIIPDGDITFKKELTGVMKKD